MIAQEVIASLGLEPLEAEGGWFRRIHTGATGGDGRPFSTTIYALFTREQFSAMHRLDAEEQFFFLGGDPFAYAVIAASGDLEKGILGGLEVAGALPTQAFPAGCWFGGSPLASGIHGWSLVAAVVTPGFRWEGFEIGRRAELLERYPAHGEAIERLTRVELE